MEFNWPVIGTNIIGFVIVVLVLKKSAWGPMLDMLDARRDKISADFTEASTARTDAEGIKSDLELQLVEIKSLEREKIQAAVEKGEDLAETIRNEASTKATATLEKAQNDIEVETQKAQIGLRDQVVDLAMKSSEMLLKKELDDDTHRKLISDYIDSLGEMPHA
jgi:F-type H+-transporting ATPase subunit b